MKFYKNILLIIIFFLISGKTAIAADYAITNFVSEINIQQDRSIKVVETIKVDFLTQKRGIFRYVPIIYRSSDRTINSRFNLLLVQRDGQWEKRDVSKSGDNIMVRIGDEDVYLSGKHTYTIVYEMQNIIQNYGDYEELYWNISGNDWDTEIQNRTAIVKTPFADITNYTCYPIENCTTASTTDNSITFTQSTNARANDLTIVVALDNQNNFVPLAASTKLKNYLADYILYPIVLLPPFVMGYFWFKRGRDSKYIGDNIYYEPENKKTQKVSPFHRSYLPLTYYPIDGLTPSQVGTIVDEKVDIADISAEIIELARLGFIKIDVKKAGRADEYLLYKTTKDNLSSLKEYQAYLYEKIFANENTFHSLKKLKKIFKKDNKGHLKAVEDVNTANLTVLSAQKDTFYIYLKKFKEKLYENMKEEGYFYNNPDKERQFAFAIIVPLYIVIFILFNLFNSFIVNPLPLIILGGLGFLLSIVFASQMPSRTPLGYSLKEQIRGLKFYINKGKWRHEIAEKNLFFEQMLPLAIALGVADKFAKQMQELNIKTKPGYINSYAAYNYSSLSSIDNKFSDGLMAGAPKSSKSSWSGGSGFSGGGGGGFGGGGGGSW